FNDEEQIRLKHFCSNINELNHKWMLSNSDLKGVDNEKPFFDELYSEFFINKVKATRRINSNAGKRGELNELLITNYTNGATL
ncbi:MAG TPA: DNA adenine methylase, partial [Prolixibacteraceae bacterium]|nr:DNA adenine methylase [Prolixibacteraceae bacterium]